MCIIIGPCQVAVSIGTLFGNENKCNRDFMFANVYVCIILTSRSSGIFPLLSSFSISLVVLTLILFSSSSTAAGIFPIQTNAACTVCVSRSVYCGISIQLEITTKTSPTSASANIRIYSSIYLTPPAMLYYQHWLRLRSSPNTKPSNQCHLMSMQSLSSWD